MAAEKYKFYSQCLRNIQTIKQGGGNLVLQISLSILFEHKLQIKNIYFEFTDHLLPRVMT